MCSLKSIITFSIISISLCVGNAQSVKDYFTQEGLSLSSYESQYDNSKVSYSISYFGDTVICDHNVSIYYHNQVNFKYYYYFEGDSVFSVNPTYCNFSLLYDFGLEVGSTIPIGKYSGYTLMYKYPVTLLNGEERLRYDFNGQVSWIEGIGDIINGYADEIAVFESFGVFVCAKIGDDLLWLNEEESDECDDLSCLYPKLDFESETEDFTVTTTNTTKFGQDYEWDFGDGTTSTEEHATHTYSKPGCYNVTLKGSKDCRLQPVEITKKVSICTSDAWDVDYYIDSLPVYNVYKFTEDIEFAFSGNTVLKTFDRGQSWVKLPLPNTPEGIKRHVFQIQFYNENDGVLNCAYSGTEDDQKAILVTHDGGLTWEEKMEGSNIIWSLTIGENGEAWASAGKDKNYLFRTLDYGYNWDKIEFEESYEIEKFTYIDENTLYGLAFVGDPPFGAYRKGISYDKGSTWEFVEFNHDIYGGTYFDKDFAYITKDGLFYITENSGHDWIQKEIDFEIESIHFNSPSHGWVIDNYDNVYYTTDSLNTYQSTNCSLNRFSLLYTFNDTIAYGTIHDQPAMFSSGRHKVNFNMNKLGGCFSIIDNDGDGFTADVDCDDSNPEVNPGMEEIPNNMIDDNCNGLVDEISNGTFRPKTISISIYPNPTAEILNIRIEETDDWKVLLFDIHGKEVLTTLSGNQLEVSNLPRGVYILKIQDKANRLLGLKKVLLH